MKQSMPNISSLTIGSRKSNAEGHAISNDSKQPTQQAMPRPGKSEQSPKSVRKQTLETWQRIPTAEKREKQKRRKGKE
jgi:hypothetical protein